jgi:hypothetical protein
MEYETNINPARRSPSSQLAQIAFADDKDEAEIKSVNKKIEN